MKKIQIKGTIKKGIHFGLTSGAITTIGLIVGLNSTTESKLVVIGGVIAIAVADAFSDALGTHISEESTNKINHKDVWEITISTFFTKFLFALSFLIPILIFSGRTSIILSIIWGFLVLILLSYRMAKKNNGKPFRVIGEHIFIATVVIIITHYLGHFISNMFKNS